MTLEKEISSNPDVALKGKQHVILAIEMNVIWNQQNKGNTKSSIYTIIEEVSKESQEN